MYQCGALFESRVFDFHYITAVILQVTITICLGSFAIAGFELELPWTKDVLWLPDPLERDGFSTTYHFEPRTGDLEFSRHDVLNHRANVTHMFEPGASIVGSLLGIAGEAIPDEIKHGEMVSAFLTVEDQFFRPYRFPVKLWADRSEKRPPKPKRKSILECPDKQEAKC